MKLTEMKGKMSSSGDKSVIDEVERGEDVVVGKFEDAVSDRDLPPTAQDLIRTVCTSIRADRDQISRLKHH